MLYEKAASPNVLASLDLEEEWFIRLKGVESGLGGWFPEVNFLDRWVRRVKFEPVVVCNADVELHRGLESPRKMKAQTG